MEPPNWIASARLGLLFTWGPFALYERGESVLADERLDPEAYRQNALEFSPERFDPREWAELAREAGAGYALLTARNADGYCLYPSAYSAWCSDRDLVEEFLVAFRRAGLHVGVNLSLDDLRWTALGRDPADNLDDWQETAELAEAQLDEVCSRYGLLDAVRIERPQPRTGGLRPTEALAARVHRLQPAAAITIRESGAGGALPTPGALHLSDSETPSHEMARTVVQRHWGYHAGDQAHRSPREIVALLAQCASRGARLLLGVGPRADGRVPIRTLELLRDVGQWLGVNGQALFTVQPAGATGANLGYLTSSETTLYLTVLYWPGGALNLAGVARRVLGVRFLADGWAIDFDQTRDHLWLRNLPTLPPDPRGTVIVIELDSAPI